MKFPWAIRIASEDAPLLAALRLVDGIEVAEGASEVWARGPLGDERQEAALASLPAVERFEWIPPDRLRRIDQRIPGSRFPALSWKPIRAWAPVALPTASLPGLAPARVGLTLVRSTRERTGEALVTGIEDFARFGTRAAAIRLNRLRFAASARGEVVVIGTPLPPLPGRQFVLHGKVATPAGYEWAPAVSPAVLERIFGVAGASGVALALWNEDGSVERLLAEQFLPATRSAIRATREALRTSS